MGHLWIIVGLALAVAIYAPHPWRESVNMWFQVNDFEQPRGAPRGIDYRLLPLVLVVLGVLHYVPRRQMTPGTVTQVSSRGPSWPQDLLVRCLPMGAAALGYALFSVVAVPLGSAQAIVSGLTLFVAGAALRTVHYGVWRIPAILLNYVGACILGRLLCTQLGIDFLASLIVALVLTAVTQVVLQRLQSVTEEELSYRSTILGTYVISILLVTRIG